LQAIGASCGCAPHDIACNLSVMQPQDRARGTNTFENTRRAFLKQAVGAAGALFALRSSPAWPSAVAEPEATPDQLRQMRLVAEAYMRKYDVPGMAVSVARHGQLVYEQAFGFADRARGERLTTSHLFRIASVSKPITSVAVFTLVEQGRLALSETVFGPRGVLQNDFGHPPFLPHVESLRIEHLLTHTGGGWQNDGTDPMFRNSRMNHHDLIAWAVSRLPLRYPPGEHYAYSNFGYCVLGRAIEKVTRRPYADYVRDDVLADCGVRAMRIGGNTLAERSSEEVTYHGQGENPYDMNIRRMDSHGGWLASASDLVRFAVRVDGFSPERDILRPETIQAMITPTNANPSYAKGWEVNSLRNWWHSGSLPGTATIMVRTRSDLCWAALTNTRRQKSPMEGDLDALIWQMVGKVPQWQA